MPITIMDAGSARPAMVSCFLELLGCLASGWAMMQRQCSHAVFKTNQYMPVAIMDAGSARPATVIWFPESGIVGLSTFWVRHAVTNLE